MRLQSAHITKYKSINDSTEFTLASDITALVGKNESGKTAALESLYRVNPLSSGHPTQFEELRDYPRRHRARDKAMIPQTWPVEATLELEQADIDAVAEKFGPKAFTAKTVTGTRRYDDAQTYYEVFSVNTLAAAQHLVAKAGLDVSRFARAKDVDGPLEALRADDAAEAAVQLADDLDGRDLTAEIREFRHRRCCECAVRRWGRCDGQVAVGAHGRSRQCLPVHDGRLYGGTDPLCDPGRVGRPGRSGAAPGSAQVRMSQSPIVTRRRAGARGRFRSFSAVHGAGGARRDETSALQRLVGDHPR